MILNTGLAYQIISNMNTDFLATKLNNHIISTKFNPSSMKSSTHEKLPSSTKENQFHLKEGDVISIFGKGERKRANFARELTSNLSKSRVASVDFSKVNDAGFYLKLEQRKRQLDSNGCPERKRFEDRLRVALEANSWFDKPIQALNLEERAKMLLILELSELPDAVIINRPTVIRQFNHKLRALRQVYRRTCIVMDTMWNFPLSITSDHTFEIGKGAPQETFVEI